MNELLYKEYRQNKKRKINLSILCVIILISTFPWGFIIASNPNLQIHWYFEVLMILLFVVPWIPIIILTLVIIKWDREFFNKIIDKFNSRLFEEEGEYISLNNIKENEIKLRKIDKLTLRAQLTSIFSVKFNENNIECSWTKGTYSRSNGKSSTVIFRGDILYVNSSFDVRSNGFIMSKKLGNSGFIRLKEYDDFNRFVFVDKNSGPLSSYDLEKMMKYFRILENYFTSSEFIGIYFLKGSIYLVISDKNNNKLKIKKEEDIESYYQYYKGKLETFRKIVNDFDSLN